uniref:Uncharacterized protein n=1 Tax=Chromera velia CCMP2878 TaxID=1169474 RepID=A0A0G4GM44_9ALVE|eukprot:Cvel_4902.t1-p1 / transcript=Cvel_4902.t1 / gene=Cvel_4902 / organism=Chromera_velia_CCMP2878 / gene_product=hypothetical protein / transcript_product=hypothetical protein / location=Cvel_scaffold221:23621-29868(-) / protein_length=996 / sequence_SO=supercontig / SO=protein_coding / is_pseudo=false
MNGLSGHREGTRCEDKGVQVPEDLERSSQEMVNALSSLFNHKSVSAEDLSDLLSCRDSFGAACSILLFIKKGLVPTRLSNIDISSGFSLSSGKLSALLSCLPASTEGLCLGQRTCSEVSLDVLEGFFIAWGVQQGAGGGGQDDNAVRLKRLEFKDADVLWRLLRWVPPSIETLVVSVKVFETEGREALRQAALTGVLCSLLHLDVSNCPLRPAGVDALIKALAGGGPGSSSKLQSLKMRNTKAGPEGARALGDAMKGGILFFLESLDLSDNSIQLEGLQGVAEGVASGAVPSLRSLELHQNDIRVVDNEGAPEGGAADHAGAQGPEEGAAGLAEAAEGGAAGHAGALQGGAAGLAGAPEGEDRTDRVGRALELLLCSGELLALEQLNLSSNEIGDGGAGVCADAISAGKVPKLRSLLLRSCRVLVAGMRALSEALGGGACTGLQVLNLGFQVGSGGVEGGRALGKAMGTGHLSELRSLNVNFCNLHAEGMEGLLVPLREGKAPLIENLDFDGNLVDNRGAKILGEAMRDGKVSRLQKLRFGHRMVGSAGACVLGSGLGSGKVLFLESLSLEWTDERGEGAVTVAGVLERSREILPVLLKSLELRVRIDSDEAGGARALGKSLSSENIPSLRHLYLSWPFDQIGEALGEGFVEGGGLSQHVHSDVRFCQTSLDSYVGVRGLALAMKNGIMQGAKKLTIDVMSFLNMGVEIARLLGEGIGMAGVAGFLPLVSDLDFGGLNPADLIALLQGMAEGVAAAVQNPSASKQHAPPLRELELGAEWGVGDEDAGAVAIAIASGSLRGLQRLSLSSPEIGAVGGRLLSFSIATKQLPRLRVLDSRNTAIAGGLGALAQAVNAENLPEILALNLSRCVISDEDATALATTWRAQPPLATLQSFILEDNPLNQGGAVALAGMLREGKLPGLRYLTIENHAAPPFAAQHQPGVGAEGMQALEEALPGFRSVRPDGNGGEWVPRPEWDSSEGCLKAPWLTSGERIVVL